MHVLIPYDITTTGMNNPYLFLLMRELQKHEEIGQITTGYGWLEEDLTPDIIHLHWPELLVKSFLPDMSRVDLLTESHFSRVLNALMAFKRKGAKLIITIHNQKPHKGNSHNFSEYYRDIYDLADGFIHMGSTSEDLILEENSDVVRDKPSFIIPHGNYDYFPNDLTQEYCRSKLSIEPNQKMILAFGAIRSDSELNLALDAFLGANLKDTVFMIAGKLPFPYKSQWNHYKTRKKLYRHRFNKRIRIVENVITPNDVQIYLKSSDLVLIPRFNSLNSGNVALGFTFGKVVCGPDFGVIGEVLKETGNPAFNPCDIHSVVSAIKKGIQLDEEGHGELNRIFASQKMQWVDIAESTVQSFKSILNQ